MNDPPVPDKTPFWYGVAIRGTLQAVRLIRQRRPVPTDTVGRLREALEIFRQAATGTSSPEVHWLFACYQVYGRARRLDYVVSRRIFQLDASGLYSLIYTCLCGRPDELQLMVDRSPFLVDFLTFCLDQVCQQIPVLDKAA